MYAAGGLIARAVQFAPQFLVISSFAAFTDPARTRRAVRDAALKMTAFGAAAVAGSALLGPMVVPLVLNSQFERTGELAWLFALLGTLLAVNQLLLAQRIARHDERAALGVWVAAGAFVAFSALWPDPTVASLASIGLGINLLLGLGLVLRTRGE